MRRSYLSLLALCLTVCVSASAWAQAQMPQKMLTLDEIFGPEASQRVNFSGAPVNPRWLKDGQFYIQTRLNPESKKAETLKFNAATGDTSPFYDAAKLATALQAAGLSAADAQKLSAQTNFQFNADQTAALLDYQGDVVYTEMNGGKARRLTTTKEEELEADFSPDGKQVSYVRGNNLYVFDLASGKETALTKDGSEKFLNGYLDWVYEEELYGRGNKRGYWWSPDSKAIAYLRIDETPVPQFVVVDHIPTAQKIEDTPYPKAGDPNPLVKLGVVDTKSGKTAWADNAAYKPEDFLISRVDWSPDSRRVIYQAQDRAQTFLDLNAAAPQDGKVTTLFREKSVAWVEAIDNPKWLKDGSFLWLSERNGWKHIYHFSADGKMTRQITDGKWEARTLDALDETGGWIYFTGTKDSHIAEQAYRVKLDGSNLTRLTPQEGTHAVTFTANGAYFLDRWSDANTPPQTRLYRGDGSLVRVIEENQAAREEILASDPDALTTEYTEHTEITAAGSNQRSQRSSWPS